jgi:hypothetical protein
MRCTFDDSPHAREQEGRIDDEHFFQRRSKVFRHYLHDFGYHLCSDKKQMHDYDFSLESFINSFTIYPFLFLSDCGTIFDKATIFY